MRVLHSELNQSVLCKRSWSPSPRSPASSSGRSRRWSGGTSGSNRYGCAPRISTASWSRSSSFGSSSGELSSSEEPEPLSDGCIISSSILCSSQELSLLLSAFIQDFQPFLAMIIQIRQMFCSHSILHCSTYTYRCIVTRWTCSM